MRFRRGLALAAAVMLTTALVTACGGDEATLTGYQREPAPQVGEITLPDVATGDEVALRADPGGLLVIYFGYTHCPDFCPTTLSDLRLALRRMDEADAARVDVAMVTVDPDRDLEVLPEYVGGFFPDGIALGTTDGAALATAAAPFGVTYDVSTDDDGEIEVAHSTALYAVDDQGELVLTWQFGVEIDDLKTDLEILLNEETA
ncbi:MAG: hypothetical protein CL424_18355 [Acidimicrobiaceae bacterium]|nr:hypothetical protein [Acidimicrobiaceae bacterium]